LLKAAVVKECREMKKTLSVMIVLLLTAGTAFGETGQSSGVDSLTSQNSTIDTGDTAWVLISAALVLLMTPGLAFFYGGLVRRKNMLSVLHNQYPVGCVRIQLIIRSGQKFYNRRTGMDISEKCGNDSEYGLRRNCTSRGLYDVSEDVRRDNTGTNHRGLCRANEVFVILHFCAVMGNYRL
jgi:hypothetical protein